MPLSVPSLDDRRFDDLVAEARAMIPGLAHGWTDHNPSDPGITLIELFAWLTEIMLYRLDQVPRTHRVVFLRLIHGPDWQPSSSLEADIRAAVAGLTAPERAVTAEDYEALTLAVFEQPGGKLAVARAQCRPGAAGEMTVLVLPVKDTTNAEAAPGRVETALKPRCLLGTRLRVQAVQRVPVTLVLVAHGEKYRFARPPEAAPATPRLALTLFCRPDSHEGRVLDAAETALSSFLDPYDGGPDGRGWPFGRAIHLSEVYGRLAAVPGVDFVRPTAAPADPDRLEALPLPADAVPEPRLPPGSPQREDIGA
jgi:hypothetical protein